jgi:outer membrane protein assembly factor BamB
MCIISSAGAADWNQWRGPRRDGVSEETGVQTKWSAGRPAELWRKVIGNGYGVVAVVGNRVYAAGNKEGQDTVVCLDDATGNTIWSTSYKAPAKLAGEFGSFYGPHSTPTVQDGKVFVLSRDGQARCLNAADGKEIWFVDFKALGAKVPTWGMAGSPLVMDDLVLFNAGSGGAAIEKTSGKVRWSSDGATGYSSPIVFSPDGATKAIAIFNKDSLTAVSVADGSRLWALPWKTSYDVNAPDPCLDGEALFITTGYGSGCARVKAADGSVLWRNKELSTQCSGGVLSKGHIYGFNGVINRKGQLRCLDAKTGAVRWTQEDMMGGLMIADGKLIIALVPGSLVIADATPDAYRELARAAKVTDGECWTMPVLSNGRIYMRTTDGALYCMNAGAGSGSVSEPKAK